MKKLYLSQNNKKIAGVCGGIGETLDVDPTLIRVTWIFFSLIGIFPGVIAYIIAWAIIPKRTKDIQEEK